MNIERLDPCGHWQVVVYSPETVLRTEEGEGEREEGEEGFGGHMILAQDSPMLSPTRFGNTFSHPHTLCVLDSRACVTTALVSRMPRDQGEAR